jgi:ATP-dependent exoDNAse (exonuclease V) beta subunit
MAGSSLSTILQKDTRLHFPRVDLVNASAGSGKTETLTHRIAQFLLSRHMPRNEPRNLLAITFTNAAATQMKERILALLKKAARGDAYTVRTLSELVDMPNGRIRRRAEEVIEGILDRYSDFRVQTIDSFMSMVFRLTAPDLGVYPESEILVNNRGFLDQAFDEWSREHIGSGRQTIGRLLDILNWSQQSDDSFIWDPYDRIKNRLMDVYQRLVTSASGPVVQDHTETLSLLRDQIRERAAHLRELVSAMPLLKLAKDDLDLLAEGAINRMIERSPRDSLFTSKAVGKKVNELDAEYDELKQLVGTYVECYAENYFQPFVQAFLYVDSMLVRLIRQRKEIFLGDLNRQLVSHISEEGVPDLYLSLGDRIAHFLIDEFQDTTPVQWHNLRPLIGNALAEGGSLFVVGDTKQSIYSFTGADWGIMAGLAGEPALAAAGPVVESTLNTSFRSDEHIVEFCKEVFHRHIPMHYPPDVVSRSGLSNFVQEVPEDRRKKGYVQVEWLNTDEDPEPEKIRILETIEDLTRRGLNFGDIAVLTGENYHVVRISSWLNAAGIPFVSFSSLDVRRRKAVGEILALLRFLDSPIDDLSFATFILGDAYGRWLRECGENPSPDSLQSFVLAASNSPKPLYIQFKERFQERWEVDFEQLMKWVGYLPLYDILAHVVRHFRLLELGEPASVAKLLGLFMDFERRGRSGLKDFMERMDDERLEWEVRVPTGVNAVKIMTIHKAKGLEFSAVLYLMYGAARRNRNPHIVETEQGTSVLYISKNMPKWSASLARIQTIADEKFDVDMLNRHYVALSRARSELHVLAVGNPNMMAKLLPSSGYRLGTKGQLSPGRADDEVTFLKPRLDSPPDSKTAVSKLGFTEKRRGEVVHAMLERIEFLSSDPANQLSAGVDQLRHVYTDAELEEPQAAVLDFLGEEAVRPLFAHAPGRLVRREQDIASPDGRIHRIDRLIVDPEEVIVVDFKTGSDEWEEDYRAQVAEYGQLAGSLFAGRRMRGVLAYVDRRIVREVL